MRATNLMFRSPKEPNTPFHLELTTDFYKTKFMKFRTSGRWNHGSIYELAKRTTP